MNSNIKKIYNQILNDQTIIDRYKQIEKFEEQTGGWAYHNFSHIMRVEKILEKVLDILNFNSDFIYKVKIACILHDTGALLGKEEHAYRSYEFSKKYFYDNNINFDDIDLVLDAIKVHSDGFDTSNIYALFLIFADKLDMTKERLSIFGKKIKGNKEYMHVNKIDISIENNILYVNFITDGKINVKEINEYYFTKKIFKAIKSFSDKLSLKYSILMDNKDWNA